MQKYAQFEFHPPEAEESRKWTTLEPGIEELVLNHDSEKGRRTTLQRWKSGARNANISLHDYCEEIVLVEGDLRVVPGEGTAEGKQDDEVGWWGRGCYAFRKPGMVHGPFESKSGCLMFITCTLAEKL